MVLAKVYLLYKRNKVADKKRCFIGPVEKQSLLKQNFSAISVV